MPIKNPPTNVRGQKLPGVISTDSRSSQSDWGGLSSSQVEGEVVSVALVHHFHAEAGTVQLISPGVQDTALTIKDGLVEVEAVQVEGHG